MLDKIKPIFSDRNEFYSFLLNNLSPFLNTPKHLIDINVKEFNVRPEVIKNLIDDFVFGSNNLYEGNENIFDYIPINFFIRNDLNQHFAIGLFQEINTHYNHIQKTILEAYYRNNDRLLSYYIDKLLYGFICTISTIKDINYYAENYYSDLKENELPIHNYFNLEYNYDSKMLNEMTEYIEKFDTYLNNIENDDNFRFILNEDKIEVYFDELTNVDYYTKYFCAYILYYVNEIQNKILNKLIDEIDEVPIVKEKIKKFLDNQTEIINHKFLNKCFYSDKIFNNFVINYLTNVNINFSEISLAYNLLKLENLILPVNESFFLEEILKYRIDLKDKVKNRFYRNNSAPKKEYINRFKKIFNTKLKRFDE